MHVWEVVKKNKVPNEAKVINTTLAMKKKANGTFQARVNAQGFMQVPGEHYDQDSISSPITNEATIRVVYMLSIVFGCANELIDVKGAYLCENIQNKKPIYLEALEGFEKHYGQDVVSKLLCTLYGLKHIRLRIGWHFLG